MPLTKKKIKITLIDALALRESELINRGVTE